jgi:ribosome biogenesis GTPase
MIDSPGFQEFGLNHIEPMHLASLMPDIKAFTSNCKFYNCTHLHEPGCGVISTLKDTAGAPAISARRYKIYSDLFAELSQKRY